MALTYNKYYATVEDLAEGVHNLGSDTLKIALSNTAPDLTDGGLADASEIAAGNGYVAGGNTVTIATSSQTTGTYTLVGSGTVVFTASGGSIADFRYSILYNDTSTGDRLIGYWDEGSTVSLGDGSSYTLDVDGVALITLS